MIEAKLHAVLSPICQTFPDIAPNGSVAPWCTYQQYAGKDLSYVEQTLPKERSGAFQVSVWAKSRSEATTLALQIEAAVLASDMQVGPEGGIVALTDPDTGLRGAVQRFLLHDDR